MITTITNIMYTIYICSVLFYTVYLHNMNHEFKFETIYFIVNNNMFLWFTCVFCKPIASAKLNTVASVIQISKEIRVNFTCVFFELCLRILMYQNISQKSEGH